MPSLNAPLRKNAAYPGFRDVKIPEENCLRGLAKYFKCHTVLGALPPLSHFIPTIALFLSLPPSQRRTQLRAAEPVPAVSNTEPGSCRAWICLWQLPVPKSLSVTTSPLKEMRHLCHLSLLEGSQRGKPKHNRST